MYEITANESCYIGKGSRNNIPNILKKKDVKNIFVVIGKNAEKHGIADMIYPLIDEGNYHYKVFNNIKPNPTIENVLEGLEIAKEMNPDVILTVGGGSVIDTAKAIALSLTNPDNENVRKFTNKEFVTNPAVPIIALPTTCGTGTETTQFFIITDNENKTKLACADKNVFPVIAIVDTDLMDGMPDSLRAATGMDALTHAIEAYTSIFNNEISNIDALKAINLVYNNLEKSIKEKDENSKEKMAEGQYIAGRAFANGGLGLVHAMAHQLGGFYDMPHGEANAILLPHIIKFNGRKCADRYKEILRSTGCNVDNMSDEEAVDVLANKVKSLNEVVGITKTLADYGAKYEDLETLATNAMNDQCYLCNCVEATKEEIVNLYNEAL